MARVFEFPDRARIEEETGRWLIRMDSDNPLSPADVEELREWINKSPVHREELSNLIGFYSEMNILNELAVPLGTAEPTSAARRERRPAFYRLAAAAAMVVGALSILTTLLVHDPLRSSNGHYSTSIGAQEVIVLSDGSSVQLNTNTHIDVDYQGRFRNVRLLQGEAYFTVAKHPDRPFRVYAGTGWIEAVGTAFAVYVEENDVNVTVAEGQVVLGAVRKPNPREPDTTNLKKEKGRGATDEGHDEMLGMLTAGQGASITIDPQENAALSDAGAVIQAMDPQDLARRLSWRRGILMFSGEPLEYVVKEISRYTTMTIEIEDPSVQAIAIGGQFRVGDTEALLHALESNFNLRVNHIGSDHVQISLAYHVSP